MKKNDDKFTCYGSYKTSYLRCLVFCPFRIGCEDETLSRKFIKEMEKYLNGKDNKKNGKDK